MKVEYLKDFRGTDIGVSSIEVPGGLLYRSGQGLCFVPEPPPPIGVQVALVDVMRERTRQDAKYGGPAHDDTHTTAEWLRLISDHCDTWLEGDGGSRQQLVKVAALAVAAVESLDRKAARQ